MNGANRAEKALSDHEREGEVGHVDGVEAEVAVAQVTVTRELDRVLETKRGWLGATE